MRPAAGPALSLWSGRPREAREGLAIFNQAGLPLGPGRAGAPAGPGLHSHAARGGWPWTPSSRIVQLTGYWAQSAEVIN